MSSAQNKILIRGFIFTLQATWEIGEALLDFAQNAYRGVITRLQAAAKERAQNNFPIWTGLAGCSARRTRAPCNGYTSEGQRSNAPARHETNGEIVLRTFLSLNSRVPSSAAVAQAELNRVLITTSEHAAAHQAIS